MDKTEFINNLKEAFSNNGFEGYLDEFKAEQLFRLYNILIESNKTFNLTAITEPNEVILKHFLDCATIIKHLPTGARIIDIGCGAGFPSLPIAILRDDVSVTSLDSTAKKTAFIENTANQLRLNNIKTVTGRAEEMVKEHRECFDVAISRAVARLNILDELCIPFVNIKGLFIAMKSTKGEDEHREAISGINKLGCAHELTEKIRLSYAGQEIERENYIYRKAARTPLEYPRNYGRIAKKPL